MPDYLDQILNAPAQAGKHVLSILALLDRVRNAGATGIKYSLDDDPETTFWSGLGKGIRGEDDVHNADLLGIPRPESTDEWLPWLGKGAVHLAADMVDPLLFLGPLSKLGKAGKLGEPIARGLQYLGTPYRAASEYLHGTSLGRAFAEDAPAHLQSVVSQPWNTALRQKQEELDPIMKLFTEGKALESGIDDMAAARQAWERPFMESQASPELEAVWQQLHGLSSQKRDEVNALAESLGMKSLIGEVGENDLYRWVPRIGTSEARRHLGRTGFLDSGGKRLSPESFESRELMLLADPQQLEKNVLQPILEGGKPVVTKLDHPLSGLDESGRVLKTGAGDIPVQPVQATMQEIYQSGLVPKTTWVKGVAESYLADIMKKENQKAFLSFMSRGLAKPGGEAASQWIKPVSTIRDIPKGWRTLKVPGMEKYAAPKWAANFVEKRSKKMFDPDTPLGMAEQLGEAALNTRVGGLFKEGTQWWKRNVLGLHPGYYFGNMVSDIPQMYLAGVDSWMLPFRKAQAIAAQSGLGARIFGNYSNRELGEEFARRGLWSKTWGASEATDVLDKAINEGFVRRTAGRLPGVAGTIGRGAATVGETWGKLNDTVLRKFGGNIEANSRIGVAIDWLKRNKINTPTPEDLDQAAAFANKSMIDYGALTPFERQMATIVPFYAWQRGILGRTAETLVESPDRLARLGRSLDMMLDPLPEEDKQISDEWIQSAAPTTGIMGTSFDDMLQKLGIQPREEGQRISLAGRFLPHTTIESLMNRPIDTAVASINPLLKAPAELFANRSSFTDRPIDSISEFPGNIVNPLVGGDYQTATEKPFGLELPASWNYILTQMPGGRTLKAASELARGLGATKDEYKAETSPGEALSWFATGGKLYPFSRDKQLRHRQWEIDRKTKEIMRKAEFAWSRDDLDGAQHYMDMLERHQADMARILGFTEGG